MKMIITLCGMGLLISNAYAYPTVPLTCPYPNELEMQMLQCKPLKTSFTCDLSPEVVALSRFVQARYVPRTRTSGTYFCYYHATRAYDAFYLAITALPSPRHLTSIGGWRRHSGGGYTCNSNIVERCPIPTYY